MSVTYTATGTSEGGTAPSGGLINFDDAPTALSVTLTDTTNSTKFNVGDAITYTFGVTTGSGIYEGYTTVGGVKYPVVYATTYNVYASVGVQVTGNEPFVAGSLPCYVAGTRIATANGEVAVEDLSVGDLVATASGAWRPIVWLGHRRLDVTRHPDPGAVRPVRVSAGAFGEGLPQRDLWLSPGHNIAYEGALIPIVALVNGVSVTQVEVSSVEYWHVELDAHDVILAEGLPAESYLDTGNRNGFQNGGAFVEAHPDFKPKHWAETCMPLLMQGSTVAQLKETLLARLFVEGHVFDNEEDAHILADGVRVAPVRLSPTRLAFLLPEGAAEIALMARKFVPAHTIAESFDARELGLCIGRLQIDGETVALDGAAAVGWHDAEHDDGAFARRWTTGATPLAAGARIVIVDLADRGRYWAARSGRGASLYA